MPRLFTALDIPPAIGAELAHLRGGLAGARWVEPANYHITLRFIGDVDGATARDVMASLAEARPRAPIAVSIDGLAAFGGAKPRSLYARVAPSPELASLQSEEEKLIRLAGVEPETRKFTPHVTLARLRDARPADVAGFIARIGWFPALRFTAERVALFSSRDSVGGGPYVVEAAYLLAHAAAPAAH